MILTFSTPVSAQMRSISAFSCAALPSTLPTASILLVYT